MTKHFASFLLGALFFTSPGGDRAPSIPLQAEAAAVTDPDQRAALLVSEMTTEEKLQLVHGNLTLEKPTGPRGAVGWVPGIPRLGIPDLLFADGNTVRPTTALPSSLASAATWDLNEAYKFGEVIGKEMRASGMNAYLGGGNVNLTAREPRDGRTFETKGEDPILAGEIASAHLKGIQQQDVLVGVKHVAMNDQETARFSADAIVSERAARESDLLAFEIALKESGAQMAMCAYNLMNDAHSCADDHVLNAVLKKEWGFRGFVISDWYATPSSVSAAVAGLDQEQPGGYMFDGIWTAESLQAALTNGDLPESRLDDMAHRILRAMIATGVLDHPAKTGKIDAAGDAALAQEIEEQGAVLLKNRDQLLPINSVGSIAVIGSHADVGVLSGGGSAQIYPMGGAALTLPPACPPYTPPPGGLACTTASQIYDPSSPLKAIRARAPKAKVTYNDGTDATAAARLAASAQIAIVFLNQWESEGMDMVDLKFSNSQNELVSAVASKNSHTIVVLENGGPVILPWLSGVGAVLESWYPGQKGGEAIANILFGSVNPSGKLPITFPVRIADLPRPAIPIPNPPNSTAPFHVNYNIEGSNVGYKWFEARSIPPAFPFGFGLSYTTFSIRNVKLTPNSTAAKGFQIGFDLLNTGSVAGSEVPQVYLALPGSTGEPKRLVGWSKVLLQPGARKRVTVVVNAGSASHPMSVWNAAQNQWITPPGTYTVYVGSSSAAEDLAEAGTFKIGNQL